jgi:HAD superfamily hydrolase (TIGR01457 family)
MMKKLKLVKGFVLDLDGVMYRGREPIPGAREFVAKLRQQKRKVFFLTNASFRSRSGTAEALRAMGVGCAEDEVMNAGYAAARYVRAKWGKCNVFVVGEKGLHEELELAGIGAGAKNAKAVVVGIDRQFSYGKISQAFDCLRAGAELIACNADASFPVEDRIMPGAGAMVGALERSAGVKARIIGKPSRYMMHLCVKMMGLKPSEVAVVGDRLETDILMANREGALGVLVLTGVSGHAELKKAKGLMRPRLVVDDLKALARLL